MTHAVGDKVVVNDNAGTVVAVDAHLTVAFAHGTEFVDVERAVAAPAAAAATAVDSSSSSNQ